jgi:hypothetical protein
MNLGPGVCATDRQRSATVLLAWGEQHAARVSAGLLVFVHGNSLVALLRQLVFHNATLARAPIACWRTPPARAERQSRGAWAEAPASARKGKAVPWRLEGWPRRWWELRRAQPKRSCAGCDQAELRGAAPRRGRLLRFSMGGSQPGVPAAGRRCPVDRQVETGGAGTLDAAFAPLAERVRHTCRARASSARPRLGGG